MRNRGHIMYRYTVEISNNYGGDVIDASTPKDALKKYLKGRNIPFNELVKTTNFSGQLHGVVSRLGGARDSISYYAIR